jgi:LemA protein
MRSLLIVLAIVLVLGLWLKNTYNGFIPKDETVKKAWGDVQNQYQRRSDLISNLVNTVKGAAGFEQKTLTDVIEARAKATQITIDPTNITPEKLKEFQAAQNGLTGALGRLMMVTENYPQLKANQNFLDLQAQLEGTENRVTRAREVYNESVMDYNNSIRTFPANVIAGFFKFNTKASFEADKDSQKAPKVDFSEPAKAN